MSDLHPIQGWCHPVLPHRAGTNFTPWYGEAGMEFTSCPRMLHSQSAGSTEIQAHDLCSQSPMCYKFGHHISHICTCIHMNIHTNACTLTHIYRFTEIHTYMYTHILKHIHAHIHINAQTSMHTYIYTHMQT